MKILGLDKERVLIGICLLIMMFMVLTAITSERKKTSLDSEKQNEIRVVAGDDMHFAAADFVVLNKSDENFFWEDRVYYKATFFGHTNCLYRTMGSQYIMIIFGHEFRFDGMFVPILMHLILILFVVVVIYSSIKLCLFQIIKKSRNAI